MILAIGITLAFLAMLCWGFGDFLIQKSTRKFGDVETLFLISLFGAIILFPFIYLNLLEVMQSSKQLLILIVTSLLLLVAALLDFEALKRGKLVVVEPIYALEIPIASFLAFFIVKETISTTQTALIVSLVVGLILVSLKGSHFTKKVWLEKGVILVLLGTLFMGGTNFMVGIGSRAAGPLMVNWFIATFTAIICIVIMIKNKRLSFVKHLRKNKKLLISMCLLDNIAWVAFAFAMTIAPISIAVALSESYILIAALLGIYINKELLKKHQIVGLGLAIISAITLAAITI